MSKIAVNEITDEVGTGAPAFPNGMSVTGAALTDPEITGGVYLGGTGSANKLDDYETGTWTPTVNFNSFSYNEQEGKYVKIGNFVHASVYLDLNISSSGSGNFSISNFPFASSTSNIFNAGVISNFKGISVDTDTVQIGFNIGGGSNFSSLRNMKNGGGFDAITKDQFASDFAIYVTFLYETDS